ncbi:MAG: aspartyl protease family protein [Cytophagales bacterium]|nr:aspartyl protease family protein [Armatimonadota bacterium]
MNLWLAAIAAAPPAVDRPINGLPGLIEKESRVFFIRTLLPGALLLAGFASVSRAAATSLPAPASPPGSEKAAGKVKPPLQRQTAIVPFIPLKGHGAPLVNIGMSDTVTATFMIDTGAYQCFMTERMAKKLGLKPKVKTSSSSFDSAMGRDRDGNPLEFVEVPQMRIGPMVLNKVQFLLLHDEEFFGFGEQECEGLIGGPLLSRFALFFDYPRKTMAFIYPGNLPPDAVAGLGMADAPSSPMMKDKKTIAVDVAYRTQRSIHGGFDEFGSGGGFIDFAQHEYAVRLDLEQNGKKYSDSLWVDTGAPNTSISRKAALALNLESVEQTSATTMQEGTVFGGYAKVSKATVGTLALSDFKVEFPGRESGQSPLLGADILSCCNVLFDFAAQKLYLKPILPPIAPRLGSPEVTAERVDKERLRQAVEIPMAEFSPVLAGIAKPDSENGGESDLPLQIAALEKRLKDDATNAVRQIAIGDLFLTDKQPEKAKAAYEKAAVFYRAQIKSAPNSADFAAKLARVLIAMEQVDEASLEARRATQSAPASPDGWLALGWATHARSVAALTGRTSTVTVSGSDESELRDLLARLRKTPPTITQMQQAQDLAKEARGYFDQAVMVAGASPKPFEERARFLVDSNLGIKATLRGLENKLDTVNPVLYTKEYLTDMEAAADLTPNDPLAQTKAATAAVELPLFQGRSGIDSRESRFWKSLPGDARSAAQVRITRLVSLGSHRDKGIAAKATEQLGQVQYLLMRNPDLAEKTLRKAALMDPTQSSAVHTLVELLTEKRRYQDIAALLQERLAVKATALDHLMLARSLDQLNRFEEAEASAKAAQALCPSSFITNLTYAALLLKYSDTDTFRRATTADECLERAEKAMGNFVSRSQRAQYNNTRAIFWGIWGDPAEAKALVMRVIEESRTDTQARDILGAIVL